MRKWAKGTLNSLGFGVPMVWWILQGLIVTEKDLDYPDLEFSRLPAPHCEEVPVLEFVIYLTYRWSMMTSMKR